MGRTQDLPPKGGYAPINFKRIPARVLFSGYQMFAGFGVMTIAGAYIYYRTCKSIRQEEIEMRSGNLAIEPILRAERDRAFLTQLHKNRIEEEKLMADVEGWEVGKFYDEPIYKTVKENKFFDPIIQEFYVHGESRNYERRAFFSLWI